jgi:hypothetical protein
VRLLLSHTPPAPAAEQTTARDEVREGSVTTVLDRIDASLRAAIAERDRCTARWAHSPTTANATAAQRAQDELDAVLDRRFAAQ